MDKLGGNPTSRARAISPRPRVPNCAASRCRFDRSSLSMSPASLLPVEKSGSDFHRLAAPTRPKSTIRPIPKYGSGVITLTETGCGALARFDWLICTGRLVRLLVGLLPAAQCITGLWISQGITPHRLGYRSAVTSAEASLRYTTAIKRTFQPKKRYRRRVHGFLRRMSTRGGARVIRNRRRKGRQRLTP